MYYSSIREELRIPPNAFAPKSVFDFAAGSVALLAAGCFLYFLASLTRSRGKIIEQRLNESLGGWQTTIVLRHRDSTIDAITKTRYHEALSKLNGDAKFPTPAEELQSPSDADDFYRSATKRLIEARRGPRYQMLHDERMLHMGLDAICWV